MYPPGSSQAQSTQHQGRSNPAVNREEFHAGEHLSNRNAYRKKYMLSKYRTQWKSKQDKKLETLEHLLLVNYKSGHTSLKTSATQKNGSPQLTGLL